MINFGTAPTKGGGFAAGSQGFMQGIMQSKQSQRADARDEREGRLWRPRPGLG